MNPKWDKCFLNKFSNIIKKAEMLVESVEDEEDYNIDDLAGHLKDILEIVKDVEDKIDDLQNQLDIHKIEPSETELIRQKNYEIQKKVWKDIFPYMYCFYEYHKRC